MIDKQEITQLQHCTDAYLHLTATMEAKGVPPQIFALTLTHFFIQVFKTANYNLDEVLHVLKAMWEDESEEQILKH